MYQLVVEKDRTSSIWFENGKRAGDVVWVRDAAAARHLVESGICSWPKTAPREVQQFEGPQERKSFGDRTDGPSTGLPSLSGAAGLVRPSRV